METFGYLLSISMASVNQGQATITDIETGKPFFNTSSAATFTEWHMPISSQRMSIGILLALLLCAAEKKERNKAIAGNENFMFAD